MSFISHITVLLASGNNETAILAFGHYKCLHLQPSKETQARKKKQGKGRGRKRRGREERKKRRGEGREGECQLCRVAMMTCLERMPITLGSGACTSRTFPFFFLKSI